MPVPTRLWFALVSAVLILASACGSGGGGGGGGDDRDGGASPGTHRTGAGTAPPRAPSPARPNVIIVVTDDQRWDSLDQLPRLGARSDVARFTRAFVEVPQCCPSRATILTGQGSQRTGVVTLRDGEVLDEGTTLATILHDGGYRTALIGKYLNNYPFERGPYVPPGWDEWAAFQGANLYYEYTLVENATEVSYGAEPSDYSTDVLTDKAVTFIEATPPTEPFFLYLAYNAPHRANGPPEPAPDDAGACSDVPVDPPPNFNAVDTAEVVPWMRDLAPLDADDVLLQRRATCATLRGVDEGVTEVLASLERGGRLQDTYLIFTSDNGYSFGEHRLEGKGHLYEESIRVPLLALGPDVVAGEVGRLTSNIDIAPTILEWAGLAAPDGFVDGDSFADNLRGEPGDDNPTAVLLRGCRTQRDSEGEVCGGYPDDMGRNWGVRTATHKYVVNADGSEQLFDLRTDPGERTNLANDPSAGPTLAELRLLLLDQRGQSEELVAS